MMELFRDHEVVIETEEWDNQSSKGSVPEICRRCGIQQSTGQVDRSIGEEEENWHSWGDCIHITDEEDKL